MDATVYTRATRNCTNWCYCKGNDPAIRAGLDHQIPITTSHGSCVPPACRKLDGVAAWLMNGVAAAFFMSLDRCSCIYIDTKDDAVNDMKLLAPYNLPNPEAKFLQHCQHMKSRARN